MGNKRKKALRNTSPKFISSKWPSPGLWTSFWQGCSELEQKIETLIDSTHIQEGYDCLTSAISDSNNILKVVKVFAPLPRGATAPVSVSEQKIQIIILILKRGPCLFKLTLRLMRGGFRFLFFWKSVFLKQPTDYVFLINLDIWMGKPLNILAVPFLHGMLNVWKRW